MHKQHTPPAAEQVQHSNKQKLIWGIICLVAPTALLVVTILAYAIVNFIAYSISETPPDAETLVAVSTPLWITISNVVFFIAGVISTVTWLPGIITGIILLSTRE